MQLMAFSIYDSKVMTYSPPMWMRSVGECMRTVSNTLASGESMLSRNPEDFALVRIGVFDDQTGVLTPTDHESFGPLVQFMPKQKPGPLLAMMEGKEAKA